MRIKAIIMAGGSGQRFWPRSQETCPKQFIQLMGQKTMLQETVDRLKRLISMDDIYISTRSSFQSKVMDLIKELSPDNLILEPTPKDTAAAMCLSALEVDAEGEDVLFFLPSDHYIRDDGAFDKAVSWASEVAREKRSVVLLGVKPTYPSSSYGYLELQQNESRVGLSLGLSRVKRFIEKPDLQAAKQYVASGHYLWNAGMFFMRQDTIQDLFRLHAPSHLEKVQQYLQYKKKDLEQALLFFDKVKKISFDYAILERENQIYCVHAGFFWDDLGSWNALARIRKTDDNGNLFSRNVKGFDCKNVLCETSDKELQVVLNGVENLNIIQEKDVLYIAHKDKEAAIKGILKVINHKEGNHP